MSSNFAGKDVVGRINFTGGFPTSRDFAPSLVYLIAYTLTLPVLFYRLVRRSSRSFMLLRPCIFVASRFGALILRIMMSKRPYGLNETIAELVLISIGYIFLIDPFIQCWKRNIEGNVPVTARPQWLKPLRLILSALLICCVVFTIAAGAVTSDAFKSSEWLDVVQGLRETSYVLTLVVLVFLATITLITHFYFDLPILKTFYILIPTLCLFVVAVYRIVHGHVNNPNAPIRSLAAFWILQMLFEFIAYIFVIAVSLPDFFPVETPGSPTQRKSLLHHSSRDKDVPVVTEYPQFLGGLEHGQDQDQYQSNMGRRDDQWYDKLYIVKFGKWVGKKVSGGR
ncbi:hypothetical protein I302_101990 [Kwoniella bestiolae CBS 10118]|uniref:Uncharacterized protein n=1 Tax=Kwoniella bestiolae CBS 10118 TaxID=1296100 RepID=A0A1B9GDV5_9TREE|nr:hypothetical protein I302_00674 [Kwoniella bestiolae CBS 10118]OCF29178.1 hypothetical protein I302_00674 [Kwoniella bestiolae CBS 10118]